ncbi:hypothetical protein ACWEOO_11520 [Kribbella sp. NPDC004138]
MLERLAAPLTTFVSVGVVAAGFALLGFRDHVGTEDGDSFSLAWTAWKLCGALAIAVFLAALLIGSRLLGELSQWGLSSVKDRRRTYLLIAVGTMALLTVLKAFGYTFSPASPVNELGPRTNAVLFAGLAAATPWLVLVWLGLDAARALDVVQLAKLPHDGLESLLQLRRLLIGSAGAFSVGVVAALLTSGALRNAMLAYDPDRTDFPASSVLLYGAVFAIVLTVLTLPFASVWRSRARGFVDEVFALPADGKITEAWVADRERLEHLLRIDVGLLRSPLTALNVFAPLVTSLLAAFVPQLGSS